MSFFPWILTVSRLSVTLTERPKLIVLYFSANGITPLTTTMTQKVLKDSCESCLSIPWCYIALLICIWPQEAFSQSMSFCTKLLITPKLMVIELFKHFSTIAFNRPQNISKVHCWQKSGCWDKNQNVWKICLIILNLPNFEGWSNKTTSSSVNS